MRVLITGAYGFVGKAVVSALSRHGFDLVLFDLPRPVENIQSTEFFGVDITKFEELERLPEIGDVDAVVHAAGLAHQLGAVSREKFWQVNVDGTKNIARLAARLNARRFILISSVSVYGKGDGVGSPTTEADACNPEGFYAVSKYESESAAREICEQNGIDLIVLRLATVIGEDDAGNVLRLIEAVDHRKFYWIGKGENRKSLVYKGDVARACLAVLTGKTHEGGTYNVSAAPETMRNIVFYIEQALGKKAPAVSIPPKVLKLIFGVNSKTLGIEKISRRAGTVEKWLSDETFSAVHIKDVYGFEPETTVEEAIRLEVAWYLKSK